MTLHVGYCTNVHAGRDLDETREQLRRHALAVKSQSFPQQPMGVGLWLSAKAATALRDEAVLQEFRDWLAEHQLIPYTFNGFPYGDFHQAVVKHRVYEPTWMDPQRLEYTLGLIAIQHALLGEGLEGSISTLPIAWGEPALSAEARRSAADQLRTVARQLHRLEEETGRLSYLCIEPEPGCFIQKTENMIDFFVEDLLAGPDAEIVRRYIRVCHDICHAVVMFETQRDVFQRYRDEGLLIGKVQVSSAVCLPGRDSHPDRQAALEQLAEFREEKYLHQTSVRTTEGETRFFEDLPFALEAAKNEVAVADGEWRVHFHVPIYVEAFGSLYASRQDILECLQAARELSDVKHFEVETYAWGVLPESLRVAELAEGIARELLWFDAQYSQGPAT